MVQGSAVHHRAVSAGSGLVLDFLATLDFEFTDSLAQFLDLEYATVWNHDEGRSSSRAVTLSGSLLPQ